MIEPSLRHYLKYYAHYVILNNAINIPRKQKHHCKILTLECSGTINLCICSANYPCSRLFISNHVMDYLITSKDLPTPSFFTPA